MAGRKVSVAVELTTGDAKAQVGGLRKEIATLGPESEASFKKLSQSSSDAAKIAKESVSTISSELIESLGVDGDIANVFGENIAKMRASTLILGGAVAGVVAGAGALVALTLKLGSAGRELQLNSEAIGLSVEKLQLYARASEAAGASAETLTGVFTKFRQETGGNEQAFDSFLKSLEAVQNPIERLSVAQGKLGELSDDARRSILALTEQNGELRKSILESGVVLSEVEARELAKVDKRFNELTLKVEGFLKRGLLVTIDSFAEFGVALGEGADGLKRLADAHANAEAEARKQKQTVDELREALNQANESAIKTGLKKRVDDIVELVSARASRALTSAETRAVVNSQLKADPTLKEAAEAARIYAQNRKAIEDALLPSTSSSGRGGRGRSAVAKGQTEEEQLVKRLTDLNKELAIFRDLSGKEFQLRLQVQGLQEGKTAIEALLKLQAEAGLQPNIPTQTVRTPRGTRQIFDLARIEENTGRLRGGFGIERPDLGGLDTTKQKQLEAESVRLKAQGEALSEQAKVAESLVSTTEALREQLAAQQDPSNVGRLTRELARRGNPDNEDSAAALAAAKALDDNEALIEAQRQYRDAVDESIAANERFRSTVQGLFDSLLDSPRRFFDQLKSLAKNFASSTLTNLFLGGNGGGSGGFSFGGGGGGGGFNPLGLLRTPGFNPSAAAGGIGGNGGGFLSQLTGGASNGIFPALAGKATGFLGKLFGIGGGSGASTVASGAVASAKAALGIGASGAGSAAGAAGAAGGGSTLASLGALFTNPITAVVAGAAIGGFFLYRSLRNRDLKKLRELARGQYGVDIKDDSTLKGIREIGKSTFGKDYNNRLAETVALPTVRDLIAQYAENSGQAGNGSLISRARLGDKFDAVNLVKREFGGPVLAGQAYIVGERRPELFIPNQSGRIAPSVNGGGSEMWAAVLGAIQANTMALQTLVTASPNDVLMKADPQAHAAVTRSAFAADYGLVNDLAYQVNR